MRYKVTMKTIRPVVLAGLLAPAKVSNEAAQTHPTHHKVEGIMKKTPTTFRNMLACFVGVLLTLASGQQARAQGIRIWADHVSAGQTHDNSVFKPFDDSHDEMYFTLAGASTHQGAITIPRIGPANDDHWDIAPHGGSVDNILLYEGFLGNGQAGVFAFALRDADNGLFDTLAHAVQAAGGILVSIFVDPSIGWDLLQPAISGFINSLSNDGDNTIGVFGLKVSNSNGVLTTSAMNSQNAQIISNQGNVVEINANGAGANYYLRLHVEQFHGVQMVNELSKLCLDVPGYSQDDSVQVQQFTCNGGLNQRWLLLHDTGTSPNAGPFTIVSENSGKCLDVRGASSVNAGVVQQYHCQFSSNQEWNQFYWFLFSPFRFRIGYVNLNSNRCLDDPGFSTASQTGMQQYFCNGGSNQGWNLVQ